MTALLAAIIAGALLAHLWSDTARPELRRATKMVAATGFLAVAITNDALTTWYGRIVLVALLLSWIGDLLLTFRTAFVAGLVAFLLGHIAYVVAFAVRGLDTSRLPFDALVLLLVGFLAVRWLWPHVPEPLRTPVLAYVVVISTMVLTAGATVTDLWDWRIRLGAVMFYVSDLFVARDRWVVPGPANRRIGLPLYFAGQVLLAWSVGG